MAQSREEHLARQGLKGAFIRIAAARTEDEGLIALHEALGWIYSLEERQKDRLGKDSNGDWRYYQNLKGSSEGKLVLAMTWVRTFAAHDLATTSDLGDVISDLFTEMVGVLVWRDRSQLPPPDRKTYGRDQFYDEHLAGKSVLDSLLVAERFLTVVMPATT